MLLQKLESLFFEENTHLVEVLDKQEGVWDGEKERGYGILIITHNSLRFGIPLRSHIKHKACFITTGTNGECLTGWEGDYQSSDEQISPDYQGLNGASGAEALDSGADDRAVIFTQAQKVGAEASERLSAQQETDAVQSEGDRRFKKFSYRWKQWKRRVAKRKSKEARKRKEALHKWTTELVESVSELTVVCPPIKESTKSAKGNERNHGAAVKTVAMQNRHVLAQAPAMSIQMLEYKAEEAGVPFVTVSPDEHALAIGRELPAAAKAVRRLRHQLKHGEV